MAKRIIAAVSAGVVENGVETHYAAGQEVDLSAEDEARLESVSALVPKEFGSFQAFADYKMDVYRAGRADSAAHARLVESRSGGIVNIDEPGGVAVAPESVGALTDHLRNAKPTVDETIALAEDDPAKAAVVLEAEEAATGGQPRKTVQEALAAIVEGAE